MWVTIKDVAKKANVSVSTVSRILNNLPGYSEETKSRVLKIIEETGYQPNAIARGLINRETKTLGVLVPSVSDLFATEILTGIEEQAQELGYSVIICKSNSLNRRDYLRTLYEKRVDGIIMISGTITSAFYHDIDMLDIPVIVVAAKSGYEKVPSIIIDEYQASFDAVNYLIKRGHSAIGIIAGPKRDDRLKGYIGALEKEGIEISDSLITHGDYLFESGIENMSQLIKNNPSLTGVFCVSDEMAVGALSYLYKQGIKVPDQLSVIGFDNTAAAKMAIPPLTTVAQPLYEMGKRSIHLLLSHSPAGSELFPHQIVERESVCSYSK